jgi:hypothetical protein
MSIRNFICLILSLVNYWLGKFNIALARNMNTWLTENLKLISLQSGGSSALIDYEWNGECLITGIVLLVFASVLYVVCNK